MKLNLINWLVGFGVAASAAAVVRDVGNDTGE